MELNTSGCIRRIDDLGRIVFPKELLRHLSVHANDPFEISLSTVNGKAAFVVTPYRPLKNWKETQFKNVVRLLAMQISPECEIGLIDMGGVIMSGSDKAGFTTHKWEALEGKEIELFRETMDSGHHPCERHLVSKTAYACPIIIEDEVVGAIVLTSETIPEGDKKLIRMAAMIAAKMV